MTTPESTTTRAGLCDSIGYLLVSGQKVGLLRCDLLKGHDEPQPFWGPHRIPHYEGEEPTGYDPEAATPHSATLTWLDDNGPDWPEAYDPDETFDTEVDALTDAQLEQVVEDSQPEGYGTEGDFELIEPAPTKSFCGRCHHPVSAHAVGGCLADMGRCTCELTQGAARSVGR